LISSEKKVISSPPDGQTYKKGQYVAWFFKVIETFTILLQILILIIYTLSV